jgi:hypothetical protein
MATAVRWRMGRSKMHWSVWGLWGLLGLFGTQAGIGPSGQQKPSWRQTYLR